MIELMGGVNRPESVNSGVDDIVAVLYLLASPLLPPKAILCAAITHRPRAKLLTTVAHP